VIRWWCLVLVLLMFLLLVAVEVVEKKMVQLDITAVAVEPVVL
jgi:hypothetical protein